MPAKHNEAARKQYWTDSMEAGWGFMDAMASYPVKECGEPLVSLPEAAREAGVEMAFSSKPTVRGYARIFRLREGVIADFLAAGREMNRRGWILKVEDGFRTRTIQKGLARRPDIFGKILQKTVWELGRVPTAEELHRRVTALVATTPKVGTHMSGTAVDISVLTRAGDEVDRGAPYLEMSELTPMASPFVSAAARRNRRTITAIMERHGFMAYPYEFWHYSSGDAYAESLLRSGKAARYGAVDMNARTGRVTPMADPQQLLNSVAEMQRRTTRALRALK